MRFIFILSLISIRSSSIQSKDIINAETYFPFPDFSLLFTVKLSNTDIYPKFFQLQHANFRLGLAEFWNNLYLFLQGQCLLHWFISSSTSSVHWDTFEQSLESQLIAIMRTFQGTQPLDQICFKVRSMDIVRRLNSVNTSRNTFNTYFSDTFGPQLLLDQKHVSRARQRFCRGNRQ